MEMRHKGLWAIIIDQNSTAVVQKLRGFSYYYSVSGVAIYFPPVPLSMEYATSLVMEYI